MKKNTSFVSAFRVVEEPLASLASQLCMKYSGTAVFFLVAITWLSLAPLHAQSPEKINFQALIRNSQGQLVQDQTVGMRLSILEGLDVSSATEIYSELHHPNTSEHGMVSIAIGSGITSHNFSSINWGSNTYFLRTDTDLAGGDKYTITSISQMFSVPYSLYADEAENSLQEAEALKDSSLGIRIDMHQDLVLHGNSLSLIHGNTVTLPGEYGRIRTYSAEEISGMIPSSGDFVFNTSENLYQIFNGENWMAFHSDCWPTPTSANAGDDLILTDGATEIVLEANAPEIGHGTGEWTILSGTGGSFIDVNNPTTLFKGNPCQSYELEWTISTACSKSSDQITIAFEHPPTGADAGENRTLTDGTTTLTLNANDPEPGYGKGTWTVVDGEGGRFADSSKSSTSFYGALHEVYTLRWTISTACDSSSEVILVAFQKDEPGDPITDIDGNTYATVWIGNQLWMAENLKATHYSDNEAINQITDGAEWAALEDYGSAKAYCYYNNDVNSLYGALYNYQAAVNGFPQTGVEIVQGVCPENWHLPNKSEWQELVDYVGIQHEETEGEALKAQSSWRDNGNGTDAYGFAGLAGGYRGTLYGRFLADGIVTCWWSRSSIDSDPRAWYFVLVSTHSIYRLENNERSHGFSVRCVHD